MSLSINTNAINDMFTIGDKGDQYIIKEPGQEDVTEDELVSTEIEELASICVAAMSRSDPSEPI